MLISYKWIKEYVADLPEVSKLRDVFTYHLCEVESFDELRTGGKVDVIFDLNILPNRAHDLLSHQGIGRELAGQLGLKFIDPAPKYKILESSKTDLKIGVENGRRYSGRIIKNIKVGTAPLWVKEHLESIGQRSINNMVDATNLVLFDSGQPCHVFDLDKIKGGIYVRNAKPGEKITTLDNKDVSLNETDVIIADDEGPLAIAGIKGGKKAEVDENTKNIVIEVANFYPVLVRKTSRRLGILTDASKRYENDLSPELCDLAIVELSALISEMCPPAEFEDVVDVYPEKLPVRKINFTTDFINKKLGADISSSEIENILRNYSFDYKKEGNDFELTVPDLRLDLTIPEDMVEEVGRIYGYDKIKPEIPKIESIARVNETFSKINWARNNLLSLGYSEVMTYSFRDKGSVEVLASASDKNFLRTNLSDGLKESIKLNGLNAPLLGLNEIRVFEIGTVFSKDKEQINIAYGDKKNVTEVSLDEFCKDAPKEDLNKIDYKVNEDIYQNRKFKAWSEFPFIARDIAVFVPESVKSDEIYKILKDNAGELLVRDPKLFDEFKKEGKISYAFRLIFQSCEKTLTDEEINFIMDKITLKLNGNMGWQVR